LLLLSTEYLQFCLFQAVSESTNITQMCCKHCAATLHTDLQASKLYQLSEYHATLAADGRHEILQRDIFVQNKQMHHVITGYI